MPLHPHFMAQFYHNLHVNAPFFLRLQLQQSFDDVLVAVAI